MTLTTECNEHVIHFKLMQIKMIMETGDWKP